MSRRRPGSARCLQPSRQRPGSVLGRLSRRFRLGLPFLVLVALVGGSCTGPPAFPINLVIEVYNKTTVDGTFRYTGNGTSGSGSITGCPNASGNGDITDIVLGPGTWTLTFLDAQASLTTTLMAPSTGEVYFGYVIRPNGKIALLYGGSVPTPEPTISPGCA